MVNISITQSVLVKVRWLEIIPTKTIFPEINFFFYKNCPKDEVTSLKMILLVWQHNHKLSCGKKRLSQQRLPFLLQKITIIEVKFKQPGPVTCSVKTIPPHQPIYMQNRVQNHKIYRNTKFTCLLFRSHKSMEKG